MGLEGMKRPDAVIFDDVVSDKLPDRRKETARRADDKELHALLECPPVFFVSRHSRTR